jgi:hypothetical protein
LGRSLALLFSLTAAAPILLHWLDCTYDNKPIPIGSVRDYVTLAFRANGLLLAYAPDRFEAHTLTGELTLATAPSLGILWIAVALAVLVRRVYR